MGSLHCKRILAIFQSLLFIHVLASATPAPIVDLGYARYQGAVNIDTNTTSFLGIRYAAPPLGNLRWAAPQPPQTMSGLQNATTQPNACHQAHGGSSSTNPLTGISKRDVIESEDCLFLSVYTPGRIVTPVESGGLPVLVWIHGGGYIAGAEHLLNGADFVVESNHGLIAVIIQYRLGLFGFLAGEAVKCGGSLNAGLLDQNYALQWVQSHIAAFGGDPTKVSIWGVSAGGGSVLQHIVAHGGNTYPPLFRAAITSSLFLPSQYNYDDPIPEFLYKEVAAGTNCTCDPDTLSCLRAADVNTLEHLNYNINNNGFYGTYTFIPVVDGEFIVERPTVTLGRGRVNGHALYSVTNTHEGDVFVNQTTTLNISQYIKTLFPDIRAPQVAAAVPLYEGLGSNVDQLNYAIGESIFICPTYYLLEAFGSKAWKGEFAIPPGHHGEDEGYYFTTSTSKFITAFTNSFMAMIMSLNPSAKYNTSDVTPAQWSGWSNGHTEMVFNVTSSGAPNVYKHTTNSALLKRCAYWRSVTAYTAQ